MVVAGRRRAARRRAPTCSTCCPTSTTTPRPASRAAAPAGPRAGSPRSRPRSSSPPPPSCWSAPPRRPARRGRRRRPSWSSLLAAVVVTGSGRRPFAAAVAIALVDAAAPGGGPMTRRDLGPRRRRRRSRRAAHRPRARCAADPALRVLLLDRSDFPRDKSCGDGIAPHVLDALAEVGAADVVDGWTPLRDLELAHGDVVVAGPMRREVHVVPRQVFDARLVERAVAAGAVLRRHRVASRRGRRRPGRLGRRRLRGRGRGRRRRRPLAWSAQAPARPPTRAAAPSRSAATRRPPTRRRGRAGHPLRRPAPAVVRLGLRPRRRAGQRRLRRAAPGERTGGTPTRAAPARPARAAAARRGAATGSDWRGHHLPLSSWRWDQPDGPVLLAGDAAGLVNPMTGEGIYYAVATGIAAGRTAAARRRRAGDPETPAPGTARSCARLLGRHLRHTWAASRLSRSHRASSTPASAPPPRPPRLRRPRRARARRRPHRPAARRRPARGLARRPAAALPRHPTRGRPA